MTIKASGTSLAFSEIATEFGYPTDNKFGNYRNPTNKTGWDLGDHPLDEGIPTSGNIKFSDFYSKRLNIVINCYDTNNTSTDYRVNAKSEWDNDNVDVVGGFRSKKESGSKVIVHVNKEIGSESDDSYVADVAGKELLRGKCALRTGSWNSDVAMVIDIGSSGALRGAGGQGGKGNNPADNGAGDLKNGREGNSALGIEFGTNSNKTKINVKSTGVIRAGYGGGGGGGGCYYDEGKGKSGYALPGCGGGGGAGWPLGVGGLAGGGNFSDNSNHPNNGAAVPGDNSTRTTGGAGGSDNNPDNRDGGDGGEEGTPAANGPNGSGSAGSSNGGSGGGDGTALRSTGASDTYILTNNGSVVGGESNSTDVG